MEQYIVQNTKEQKIKQNINNNFWGRAKNGPSATFGLEKLLLLSLLCDNSGEKEVLHHIKEKGTHKNQEYTNMMGGKVITLLLVIFCFSYANAQLSTFLNAFPHANITGEQSIIFHYFVNILWLTYNSFERIESEPWSIRNGKGIKSSINISNFAHWITGEIYKQFHPFDCLPFYSCSCWYW